MTLEVERSEIGFLGSAQGSSVILKYYVDGDEENRGPDDADKQSSCNKSNIFLEGSSPFCRPLISIESAPNSNCSSYF